MKFFFFFVNGQLGYDVVRELKSRGYNDIFAPGWTVASLWELFSPGRAEKFLKK